MSQQTEEERSAPSLPFQGAGWQVGDWRVDAGLNQISAPGGEARRLEPRVMELLVYLAQNPGVTLSRERILDAVWQGASVVDGVLPRAVSELRAALGDDAREPRFVQTVPRRGYRLIASVAPAAFVAAQLAPDTPDAPDTQNETSSTGGFRQRVLVWLIALALVVAIVLVGLLLLQAEIARQVVREIDGDQTDGAPGDSEALDKTRKGRYYLGLRSGGGLRTSRDLFLEALVADHDHAPAWAGLAECYVQLANYQILTPAQAYPAAREAADRAVELDPGLPEAHVAQGLVELHREWDLESAEAAYRRAISLGPSYATAHQLYAELLSFQGRHDEALREIRTARQKDPFSPLLQAIEGVVLLGAGRYEESADLLAEVYRLEPVLLWTRRHRAYALERSGRPREAAEERAAMALAEGEPAERLREMIDDDGLRGFYRWRVKRVDLDAQPAAMRAEFFAGAGEDDEALRWIDRAVEEKGEALLHLQRSPAFDRLRDHPRFRDPLVAAGFDPSIPSGNL